MLMIMCARMMSSLEDHHDMILKLMKDNNIYEPNQVIKVGDTYNDILEGINAGVSYPLVF